ncbi:hypothetical protein NDU88_006587 [Pleurodeles waltl]|uniref:Secreted protein n=1 Tax=Pleurodeles waltl TaxID=8319 RepID=A0AAV7SQB1_PLEWA|nr:hypothetical protein NDU88_006587 [Pleurodeles waltl]
MAHGNAEPRQWLRFFLTTAPALSSCLPGFGFVSPAAGSREGLGGESTKHLPELRRNRTEAGGETHGAGSEGRGSPPEVNATTEV